MPGRKRKLNPNDFQPVSSKGNFAKKNKGIGQRPKFDKKKLDITGLQKNTPLDVFLSICARPKNVKQFAKERDSGRVNGGTRRSTIWSILGLQEIVYKPLTAECNTDLACIIHLLESDLVTTANYENVFGALDKLIKAVLYRPEDYGAEQRQRSAFLDALATHVWFRSSMRTGLISDGIFVQDERGSAALQASRKEKQMVRLATTVKVDAYTMLEIVKKLVEMVEDESVENWLEAAIALIQISVGARWIEVLVASKFELSTIKAYDPASYIRIIGVAKEGSKAKRAFKKKLEKAMEDAKGEDESKGNILEALVDAKDQDLLELVPDVTITKPVLFSEYGVTPKFIVSLVGRVRDHIGNETDRKELSRRHLGRSIQFFNGLWSKKLLRAFPNKTHTWRKLYGNYSHKLYNRDGNLNIWLLQVLGHTSITTSFSYADVVVTLGAIVQDKNLRVVVEQQQADIKMLMKQMRELQQRPVAAAAGPASPVADTHYALKKLGYSAENRETVSVAVYTDAEQRTMKKRFKPGDAAARAAHITAVTNRIADELHKQEVSSDESAVQISRLGVPREIAKLVKARLAALQQQPQQ